MRSIPFSAAGTTLALALALILAPVAGANHSTVDRVSIYDPPAGNADPNASFVASTVDGSHVLFAVASAPQAPNGSGVLFDRRSDGTTTLISADESGQPHTAKFLAMSKDGSHVFFESADQLTSEDHDTSNDFYERFGNVTRLVSTGPSDPQDAVAPVSLKISQDGTHAFFDTRSKLVPGDNDTSSDVYERTGGVTTLASTRANGNNGGANVDAGLFSVAADGSGVFFVTDEALVPQDGDTTTDLYERVGGTTTLVTDWNSTFAVSIGAVATNGSRAIVSTRDSLVPADTDSSVDIYEIAGAQRTLLSTGSAGNPETTNALYAGATPDAGSVWFKTSDRLTTDDVDNAADLYERSGGTTTLITTGPTAGTMGVGFSYVGQGGNGTHTYFETYERLVPEDTDNSIDVYERVAGTTSLVSTGPTYAGADIRPSFKGASWDGSRVFFETIEPLTDGTTADEFKYVYERFQGVTYMIGRDPTTGAATTTEPAFGGATLDGNTVYYNTFENIDPDTDGKRDVYATKVSAYPRPKGATPLRIALVPAYLECTAPNNTHSPALAFPSCSPPTSGSTYAVLGGNGGTTLGGKSIGSVRVEAIAGAPGPPADSDIRYKFSLTNVMWPDLSDYTGSLHAQSNVRLTDVDGGTTMTSEDFPLGFDVPCTPTADPSIGSTCATITTAEAVMPGTVAEGQRSIWGYAPMKVYDGGPDGDPATSPNGVLAAEGVYIP